MRAWAPALALVLLLGCARPQAPIRLGINPWPGDMLLLVAQDQGYFRDEGVPLQLVYLTSQGDLRRAYERGQVDLISCTNVELLLVPEHARRGIAAFYVIDYSSGVDAVYGQPGIRSIAELRGRRIGLETGTLDMVMAYHALKSAGLTLRDVTLVPTAQPNLPRVFAAGEVDAAYSYPPYADEIESRPGVTRLFDSAQAPYAIVDLLAGDPELLRSRRAELLRLLRAYARAERFAAEQPQAAYAIAGRTMRMPAEQVGRAHAGITRVRHQDQAAALAPGGRLERSLAETRDILREQKLLTGAAEPRRFINADLVREAYTP